MISKTVDALQPSLIRKLANSALGREGLIPLWFGEPDVPTPEFIREAAKEAIDAGQTFYLPNAGIPELREALATYMNGLYGSSFAMENITVTTSGMTAVALAAQCILEPGDRVVIPAPVWPNLPSVPQILNAEVVSVPLRPKTGRWTLDLDELFAACDPIPKAIFLNSPNNPTGWMLTDAEQDQILEFCRRHGIWIISDEVYSRIVYDRPYAPTFANKVTDDDRYLIINSFSKAWAMTGWRLGWLTAPISLKTTLEMLVEYNFACVFEPIQRAGIIALEQGEPFVSESISRYKRSLDIALERFKGFPRVDCPIPHAAFYLFFSIDGETDSFEFAQRAINEAGVGMAPGAAFGREGEGYLRICYAKAPTLIEQAFDRLTPLLR